MTNTHRPLCEQCGINWAQKNYKKPGQFQKKCSSCSRGYANRTAHDNKVIKMNGCEECGFIPIHPCQMDIDHINGDHTDNSPENRRVLCATCHRLKTWKSREIRLDHRLRHVVSSQSDDKPDGVSPTLPKNFLSRI